MGAPAKAVRLMVGLQYLKYAFNESQQLDRGIAADGKQSVRRHTLSETLATAERVASVTMADTYVDKAIVVMATLTMPRFTSRGSAMYVAVDSRETT